MIHLTIALAYEWLLDMKNPSSIDAYEGDYQDVKPYLFTVLSARIREKSVEEQAPAKSAVLVDCEYAEIFCAMAALDADAFPDG